MNLGVNLQNPGGCPIDAECLKRAARAAFACQPGGEAGELSIVISDSKTIRELNLRYAKVDAPTDVLSFTAEQAPREPGDCARYLGDIVIAYDYAADQAEETGAALGEALCLLVIHGALHLLGYHHDTTLARERMWAAQASALRAIQIDPAVVATYGNSENDQKHLAANSQRCG